MKVHEAGYVWSRLLFVVGGVKGKACVVEDPPLPPPRFICAVLPPFVNKQCVCAGNLYIDPPPPSL